MKAYEFLRILTKNSKYDYFASRRLIERLFSLKYELSSELELDDNILQPILKTIKNNQNYPIDYLIGEVTFYKLKFKVTPAVLIPRQETEELVDLIIKRYASTKKFTNILDIGTGSGVIGISLSKQLNIPVTLSDLSVPALKVATLNAKHNNVDYEIVQSDFLSEFLRSKKTFDLIVSNPPYIGTDDEIGEEIKYEPEMALFAPNNGMEPYYRILTNLSKVLSKDGIAFFETSALHHDEYLKFKSFFPRFNYEFLKDYSNKWRFMIVTKKNI